ncbi:2-hydroxychromene-2-carboxylate isomerase [Ancylobacter sp. 6x-1]|uniref:2-hydroxychromene-2-carboxylate isomerase n=1 Tax=Ancylobacter crimeensis TaxID=2579147 RepID=A0ABT0D7X9_9HYPH|nr:2-hydroxychromene-2-carboxylate isomerase [Ancylobacter crimeensis]MCK0196056.1 2-hydroxychromene-2-carboxylate isomerase [Ancylobacter crimeensis]
MFRTLDYYFSIHSPFAFLGNEALAEIARRHEVQVVYRPVLLGPLFDETGGLPLGKRHPARQRYRLVEMQRWQERRGVAFNLMPLHWPFDPALADRLVIAAVEAGFDPGALVGRLFAAVWQRQENLAETATLLAVLQELGLPSDILVEASGQKIAGLYEENRRRAVESDVFGSPSYVLDGEVFWGQDRIELLEQALSSRRRPYRPG